MKKTHLTITCFLFLSHAFGQTHVEVKADTVKVVSGELTIQNASKNVQGFLYNVGNGITAFARGLIKIDDTTYLIGADTLHLPIVASQSFQQTLDVTNGNLLNHDNAIKVNNHNLIFDTADNFTIKARYPNIWHPFSDATSTKPATFLVLKNDGDETPNNTYGAMIAGSANGGAIVFNNDFSDASNRSLKLGIVDNSGTFSNMMKFNYSALGNKIITPLVQSAQINSIVIQHGDTLYKASLSQLSDSLSSYLGGGSDTHFANTDLTATGNRTHNFRNYDLTIDSLNTLSLFSGSSASNFSGIYSRPIEISLSNVSGENSQKASDVSVGSEYVILRTDNGGSTAMSLWLQPNKVSIYDGFSNTNAAVRTRLNIGAVKNFADNAAAIAGGLVVGDIYRNGDVLQIVH